MNEKVIREIPDASDIHLARARIHSQVRQTPVVNDPGLDQVLGCKLYLKLENLQRMGAFKFRGASNAVLKMVEDGHQGDVATHSSGNHGAALALAASLAGRTAHVVMPKNSSLMKIDAVRGYGGQVHLCEPTHESRNAGLEKLVRQGLTPVHPYDNRQIISGQGTAALELEQEVPTIEQIITPLGGGGLISGTAIATQTWGAEVYGVEPEGAADTVASLERGRIVESFTPDTVADGLRALVGVSNFQIIRNHVKRVFTVSDADIRQMMVLFWSQLKMLIEPSSATVLAAIRNNPDVFGGRKVGAIITGGNIHPSDWLELTGKDEADA